MTFDKSAIFHKENKLIGIDVEMNQDTSKHVKLEVRASERVFKDASAKSIEELV